MEPTNPNMTFIRKKQKTSIIFPLIDPYFGPIMDRILSSLADPYLSNGQHHPLQISVKPPADSLVIRYPIFRLKSQGVAFIGSDIIFKLMIEIFKTSGQLIRVY